MTASVPSTCQHCGGPLFRGKCLTPSLHAGVPRRRP